MLAGTLAAPVVIRRGGHIRAFAAFVALAVVSVVLMPVFVSPWAWLVFRALIGFVFAGLYAVIEAWINAKATNANRGALYALYQIANFSASAGGQMLLQPLGPGGFSAFRGRRRAARARHRADGDDERRSAGPAAQRPPAPPVAHPGGAALLSCRARRRRGQRRLVRARPHLRGRHRHVARQRAAVHLGDRDRLGARRLSGRRALRPDRPQAGDGRHDDGGRSLRDRAEPADRARAHGSSRSASWSG